MIDARYFGSRRPGGASATWTTPTSSASTPTGGPVLIDVFCMAGTELYRAILEDVAEVHRRIPRERMHYALDIPYIARENSTTEDPRPQKRLGTRCPVDDHAQVCREQRAAIPRPLPNTRSARLTQPNHPGNCATCARSAATRGLPA